MEIPNEYNIYNTFTGSRSDNTVELAVPTELYNAAVNVATVHIVTHGLVMIYITILFLCTWHAVWTQGINFYDTPSVKVFEPPRLLDYDTFFGFSTAYDQTNKRLIVSAPKENITGQMYQCNITTQSCSKLDDAIRKDRFNEAIGYFIEEDTLCHAESSTYGIYGTAQIYFYSADRRVLVGKLDTGNEGDLTGSMFGAVLCAARLHKNGAGNTTDLLVGAPKYALRSGYNVGAVYVYIFRKGDTPKYKRRVTGQKDGSYFGSAIISVGDLNGDGIDEIAISAPYEDDGRGAVYIYCGTSLYSETTETALTWRQRLQPEATNLCTHIRVKKQCPKKLDSLGLSLTAVQDYDENGCNELAISAPQEDLVMLYRCTPVVTVTALSAHFPNLQNRGSMNMSDVVFQVCIDVKYPFRLMYIEAELSTDVEIIHPDATLTHSNKAFGIYNFLTPLQDKKSQYCENIDLSLPRDGDYTVDIQYKISTSLLDSHVDSDRFDSSRVILSDLSQVELTGAVWGTVCSYVKKNNVDLILTVDSSMRNISYPFVIGSSNKGTLGVTVLNSGKVAHNPYIHVTMTHVMLYLVPIACSKVSQLDRTWKCTLGKPLKTNETWQLDVVIDLQDLTSEHQNITFIVELFEGCNVDKAIKRNTHVVLLRSASEYIHVKGITNIGEYVQLTEHDLLYRGKEFEHVYRIVNNGPTNFVGLVGRITMIKQKSIKFATVPVFYFTETSLRASQRQKECEILLETEFVLIVQCWINDLAKQDNARLAAIMEIVPTAPEQETRTLVVSSSLTLQSGGLNIRSERVTTLIEIQNVSVNLRLPYLAGASLGLVLLIVLIVILYRCNCLQRTKQEQLEKLKQRIQQQKDFVGSQREVSAVD